MVYIHILNYFLYNVEIEDFFLFFFYYYLKNLFRHRKQITILSFCSTVKSGSLKKYMHFLTVVYLVYIEIFVEYKLIAMQGYKKN